MKLKHWFLELEKRVKLALQSFIERQHIFVLAVIVLFTYNVQSHCACAALAIGPIINQISFLKKSYINKIFFSIFSIYILLKNIYFIISTFFLVFIS